MKFTLEIELGNDAMQSWQDIRDALKAVIVKTGDKLNCHATPTEHDGTVIFDENGNIVGKWEIAAEDADEHLLCSLYDSLRLTDPEPTLIGSPNTAKLKTKADRKTIMAATTETLTYRNPRMTATILDWPSGSKCVTARFDIEQNYRKGERAVRTTTGYPRKLTFAKMARIVDGSDGRTYIAEYTIYGNITIMRGDMKFAQETIHPSDARFPQMLELFA
jgi:hypothetical protein